LLLLKILCCLSPYTTVPGILANGLGFCTGLMFFGTVWRFLYRFKVFRDRLAQ
jgi:hypothetical protein